MLKYVQSLVTPITLYEFLKIILVAYFGFVSFCLVRYIDIVIFLVTFEYFRE